MKSIRDVISFGKFVTKEKPLAMIIPFATNIFTLISWFNAFPFLSGTQTCHFTIKSEGNSLADRPGPMLQMCVLNIL